MRRERIPFAVGLDKTVDLLIADARKKARAEALVDAAVAVAEVAADRGEDRKPYVNAIRALKDAT